MQHYEDNLKWINEAGRHQLVVGSQARILYSDAEVCNVSTKHCWLESGDLIMYGAMAPLTRLHAIMYPPHFVCLRTATESTSYTKMTFQTIDTQ